MTTPKGSSTTHSPKKKEPHIRARLVLDPGITRTHMMMLSGGEDVEAVLVKGGKSRAYVWVGNDRGCIGTIKGRALQRFAQSILLEMRKP